MQAKHDSGGLECVIFIFTRFIYIGKPSVVLDNSVPTVFTIRRDEDTVRQKLARSERLKKGGVYLSQTVKVRQSFQTTKVLIVKSLMCAA